MQGVQEVANVSSIKRTSSKPDATRSFTTALLLLQPLRLALSLQIEVVPRLLQQPERRVGLGAVMLQRQSAFTNLLK